MKISYSYRWVGNRIVVTEREDGVTGHSYYGELDRAGVGITIFPRPGGFDPWAKTKYVKKRLTLFDMVPEREDAK